jgi:hypothetical protein
VSERFGPIDFDRFHTVELPERLAGDRGETVRTAVRGLAPIAFRLEDGTAYTYAHGGGGLVVNPGSSSTSAGNCRQARTGS